MSYNYIYAPLRLWYIRCMVWQTHTVSGLLLTAASFQLAGAPVTVPILALAALGALAPDLDASESKAKHLRIRWGRGRRRQEFKPFFPLAMILHRAFGHRGVMHSLFFVAILGGISFVLHYFYGGAPLLYIAFHVGYVSHILTDSLTPSGTPILYPWKKKICFLPKQIAIRTGSMYDYGFLAAVLIISLILFKLGFFSSFQVF